MLRLGIDGRHDLRLLSVRLHEHLSKQIRDRLVGPVVKASASRAEDPWLDSRLRYGDFSGLSHTSDLKIGTPVATLPGAWRYRVSARTGWLVSVHCELVRYKV